MACTLSARDLALMRTAVEDLLPSTAVRQRNTRSADGAGGFTDSWLAGPSYACRIVQAQQPQEIERGGGIAGVRQFEVLLPWDADVLAADRLVADGRTFEVIGTDQGRSWPAGLAARCVLIE